MADLLAHPHTPCVHIHAFHAGVVRTAQGLAVHYRVDGNLERLRIPAPGRREPGERLWEHMCFELFVAAAGAQAYHEFNFSPSGQWAAYAFERYREGGAFPVPDPAIAVRRAADCLEVDARVAAPPERLRLGVCAVIEDHRGMLSYWALKHAPGKPDFHRAEAFALELE